MRFGKYEVSETGEVVDSILDLPVEQFMNNDGKMCVRLYMNGRYKVWEIKKLMAEAFKIPHEKGDVLVIDGDFNVKNFHYISRKEHVDSINNKRKKNVVMISDTGETMFKSLTDAATYIQSVADTESDLATIGVVINCAISSKRKVYGYRWERR